MDPVTVSLSAAILFFLIAVVGGGFTLKELSIPVVPTWARATAAMLGVLFAVPWVLTTADARSSAVQGPNATRAAGPRDGDGAATSCPESPEEIICQDVMWPPAQVGVDDRITVSFTIENVGQDPLRLQAFVKTRNPDDRQDDFGHTPDVGMQELAPQERLQVTGHTHVDEPGLWTVTPCYQFRADDANEFCPESWPPFGVDVVPR